MKFCQSLTCCLIALVFFPSAVTGDGKGPRGENQAALVLPAAFSWGDKDGVNWMTPIGFMDQCPAGTCAFPLTGAFEPRLRITMNDSALAVDLSEQHLISCHHGSCGPCSVHTFMSFLRDEGVPDEECFPYTGDDVACEPCADLSSRLFTIDSWSQLSPVTVESMKAEIYYNGPLITFFEIYSDFSSYTGGVYQVISPTPQGATNVVLYGWDDAESCWLAKNHWGTSWWGETGPDGTLGWFRVRMGTNEAGCETAVYTLTPTPLSLFADGFESGDTSKWGSAVS